MIGAVWGFLKAIPLRVWLAVGLGLSLTGNVVQVYRAGVAAERARAEVDKAAAAAREAAQASVAAAAARLADVREEQRLALIEQLRILSNETEGRVQQYRRWVRQLPPLPATCGPGEARVEAFNRRE